MSKNKSRIIIENAYCCGHGEIVHRLENYCLSKGISYIKREAENRSYAILGDKKVELKPTLTLSQVLQALGIQSSRT